MTNLPKITESVIRLPSCERRSAHNLQQTADRQAENQLQDAVVTRLLELNPFEVPPSLVREQLRRMLIDARMVSS